MRARVPHLSAMATATLCLAAPLLAGPAAYAPLDDRPDATIETNLATLAALVYDGLGIEEALSSGDLKIEGSKQAVERFLGLFSLPDPAAPAAGA